MTSERENAYLVVLELRANCFQNKAGSRKKTNRLFTLVYLEEKLLDAAVELFG